MNKCGCITLGELCIWIVIAKGWVEFILALAK